MISIESMTAQDVEAVCTLSKQLGYILLRDEFQTRFEKLRQTPDHELLVAKKDHQIVGWIHLSLISSLIEDFRTEIKALVVDEKYRGQNIGKKLIESTIHWSRKHGTKKIFLRTNIIRQDAHRFYEREKFMRKKTSHIYELKI